VTPADHAAVAHAAWVAIVWLSIATTLSMLPVMRRLTN